MKSIFLKIAAVVGFTAGTVSAQVDTNTWPGVFDPFTISTLHFEVNTNDWDRIRHDTNFYDPVQNVRVPCLMWEEGSTNKMTVQIRRKSDSALPSEANPVKVSLKIDINEYVKGQKWRSLEKLSLENGHGGNGVLKEGFAMQLHRLASEGGFYNYEAGYSAWIRVFVNGSYVGLYSSPEQRDKRFLQHRGMYKPGASWLYESNPDYSLDTTVNTTNSPTYNYLCFSPFRRQNPCAPSPNFETALPQWIDMESMLTFAAVEAFTGNSDGFFTHTGKNSFVVDFLPSTQRKRLHFPWDLDAGMTSETFNIYSGGPGQDHFYQTLILGHYWFRQVYRHTMTDLLDGPLSATNLSAFIDRLAPVLGPALAEDPNAGDSIASLRQFLINRSANVRTQVGATIGAPVFNQKGGEIISGFQLSLTHTNTAGTIYYTLNGADPRAVGGAASGTAYTAPVTLSGTTHVMARVLNGTNWSALREGTFNVAGHASGMRITEIMYNPVANGTNDDAGEYEYLEMKNNGGTPVDLSNAFLEGVDYQFTPGTVIAPGAFVLLVRNPVKFASRYPGVPFTGVYFDGISADGEKISLKNSDGNTICSVSFSDESPWPKGPNGMGYSLVPVSVVADLDNPENWRASTSIQGSPGADDPAPPYGIGVVVNEVLGHTDTPFEDAIELYNTSSNAIDISGWYLSDSLNETNVARPSLKKYKIPAGTIVPARGYKTFYEGSSFNPGSANANALVPFAFSKSGEKVYLSSADAAGNLTGHILGFEFGAQDNPVTYGRYQTSAGPDLTFLTVQTFGVSNPTSKSHFRTGTGLTNSSPKIGPVVINEIMFHPTNGGTEFVELYNRSNTNIDLGGWVLGGANLTFASNTIIAPGNYLVLVGNTNTTATQFRNSHNVPPAVPVVLHPFDLQNDGEKLELSKVNDDPVEPVILVDRVRYNDKAPWPTEADGTGPSLERTLPGLYGNDPASWRTTRNGGSPGRANSTNEVIVINSFSTWEAHDAGWNLGTAWRSTNYSNGSWLEEAGPLGFGDAAIRTLLTKGQAKRPVTTYFRKEFVLPDSPAALSQPAATVSFMVRNSDGFVAYINGEEVARQGMPAGSISNTTLASTQNPGNSYVNVSLAGHYGKLVQGRNVLAIELHQASTNETASIWDASLKYNLASSPVSADTDGDGMSDAWEDSYAFDKNNQADAAQDADSDGMSNLSEFLAGTDPRDHNSKLRIVSVQVPNPSNLVVRWSSVSGKNYILQSSTNLLFWSNLGAPISGNAGETEVTTPATTQGRFYRILLGQ